MMNQRKKRSRRSRAACILTAGLMIFSVSAALTGCKSNKSGDGNNAVVNQQEAMKTLAYKVTEVPIEDISGIVCKNGKYYGYKHESEIQGEGDNRVYLYSTDIVEFDRTGNVIMTIPIFKQTKENEYGGASGNLMIDDEGNITVLTYQNTYDEKTDNYDEKNYICKFDPQGNEISRTDAATFVTREEQEDNMWLQGMLTDKAGNLYLNLYSIIRVYDSEGNKLFDSERLNTDNSWVNGMFMTNSGVPAVAVYEYSEDKSRYVVKEIDVNAKGFGKEYELNPNNMGGNPYDGSKDYLCYFSGDTGINGVRADTLESEQVINLLNIGVDNSQINEFAVNEDGSFILTGYVRNGSEYTNAMSIISPVDPSEVKEKKILSLGCFYIDWSVRSQVARFNKENEDYTISVTSYSENNDTSDWEASITKFNNEILAGNVPDILQINSRMPYDSYAAKGLFTDLYELIENDGSVTKESFMPNVLSALEKDGKLYSICTTFNVNALIGKKSVIGDNPSMSMEEAKSYLAKLEPEATLTNYPMSASDFLSTAISYNNLVDYKNAVCYFDSPEFIQMLEQAKEYPAEIDYEKLYNENPNYWEEMEAACAEGRALLQSEYFYEFESYNRVKHGYFKGEDITFVNFPGADENTSGAGIMSLGTQFAISNKSAFKQGAWEFIMDIMRGTVTEGGISNWSDAEPKEDISGEVVYSSNGSGFPVYAENLQKLAIQAQKPGKYVDSEGNIQIQENTWWMNNEEVKIPLMTEADVNFMMDYLKSITNVSKYDSNIDTIINEESKLYFSGSKSAEETAAVIQSKVKLYLNEQYR